MKDIPTPTENGASATPSGSLPYKITVNGQRIDFSGTTVSDLIKSLEIKTRAIAVELNKQIVPADQLATTKINADDSLEVVTLVGGG